MPNLNIKNVPRDLYHRLKKRAAEHRRSLNSEVLVSLEMALGGRRADAEESLARLRALQKDLDCPLLTDAMLRKAKRRGRP